MTFPAVLTIRKIRTTRTRFAEEADLDMLLDYDPGIDRDELFCRIWTGQIYITEADNRFAGWLRYNLFADAIPCLNMLYVFSQFRNRGYGTQLLQLWEQDMKNNNYKKILVLIPDEQLRQFYVQSGYTVAGNLQPSISEYSLIMTKNLI